MKIQLHRVGKDAYEYTAESPVHVDDPLILSLHHTLGAEMSITNNARPNTVTFRNCWNNDVVDGIVELEET